MSVAEHQIVDRLNRDCHCVGTNVRALNSALDRNLQKRGVQESIAETHPHLFSTLPVFIASQHLLQMRGLIEAVEHVVSTPGYQSVVLKDAPEIARINSDARGAFMGYDFHITNDGPKLIEINTNAGGAMLNVAAAHAQQGCCTEVAEYLGTQPNPAALEDAIVEMFQQEWRLSRGDAPLRCVAIVDENPRAQYLYPEFVLFQQLFESHGVRTLIAGPEELEYRQSALWVGDQRIDLVYNRLTDFYLASSSQLALAQAYSNGEVVLTPNPRTHALYANKQNLVLLSDATALRSLNVPERVVETLIDGVPRTERVCPDDAERWWKQRKEWFFKPVHGFGSRGAYRGDKLTRSAFIDVSKGDYVAQKIAPVGERRRLDDSVLKFDVRAYAYGGSVQLLAARVYQGQTTNFRTENGGFAPVYRMTDHC